MSDDLGVWAAAAVPTEPKVQRSLQQLRGVCIEGVNPPLLFQM